LHIDSDLLDSSIFHKHRRSRISVYMVRRILW
jgi:hypothetical protein